MKKHIFIFVLPLLLLFGCNTPDTNLTIKIIETTDVHGSIFPYDFIRGKSTKGSITQVASFVKAQQADKSQWTLLLDNGDILQGQPTVYYSNFVDTLNRHICAQTMNYLKYDAATVGNHDIEAGHKVYDKLVKEFKFPWLAANAWDIKNNRPYFQPYAVFTKDKVKVVVLGLITPGIPNWLPPDIYSGIEFRDMVKSAKLWMEVIKRKENPDVVIGLFHAGHDYTYGGQSDTTFRNENATLLVAKQVPGFDVIFCGHDHDKFMQKIVNIEGDSVLVIDPKAHAEYIGIATINIKRANGNLQKSIKGEIVPVENLPEDSAFAKQFNPDYEAVKQYVSDTIAYFDKPIDGREAFWGDNAFMDLIHLVQLQLTQADVSLAAPLSKRAFIDSGVVTVADMFKLYKYENLLYTMQLSGREIKDFLEYSYGLWANQMKTPNDHLLFFDSTEKRLKNPYFNFDSGEGIIYTVDVSKPAGQRVNITQFTDGRPFELDKYYKVAVNSYRGNGGGGHLTKGAKIPHDSIQSRILHSTEKDLRFYMMQYLRKQHSIIPKVNKNWKFIPEDWAKKAQQRDRKILFH